ncbi:F-box protein At5g03970-like isoform X2 [Cornus florida]|nr:F-box protein At5g03970-like isoform X2 [Cornus florida]XP_059631969.1 F-box protein At5g03970-like isoform X2 [Cornus florida]
MEKVNGGLFIDDLLIEILLRLPLKTLFALKSVSKRWYRIISSPCFRQRYQSQRNEQDDSLSALLGFFQSVKQNSFMPTSPQLSNNGFVCLNLYGDLLIGSSNGLLLYYNHSFRVYRICNPITREWLSLPHSGDHLNNAIGFDVEGISDQDCKLEKFKFKVVCIKLSSFLVNTLEMEVFSSENKIWVEYTLLATTGCLLFRPLEYAVVIDGVYYWWERLHRVVAYDSKSSQELVVNIVEVIQLPERNSVTIERSFVLGKSKDGLLQYVTSDTFKIVIWVRDGIGASKWILRHTVSFMLMRHQYPDIMSSCDLILNQEALRNERNANVPELAALHPLNPDIVFIRLDKMIFQYCLDSGCLKRVQLHGNEIMLGESRLPKQPLDICKALFPYFLPTWAYSLL